MKAVYMLFLPGLRWWLLKRYFNPLFFQPLENRDDSKQLTARACGNDMCSEDRHKPSGMSSYHHLWPRCCHCTDWPPPWESYVFLRAGEGKKDPLFAWRVLKGCIIFLLDRFWEMDVNLWSCEVRGVCVGGNISCRDSKRIERMCVTVQLAEISQVFPLIAVGDLSVPVPLS